MILTHPHALPTFLLPANFVVMDALRPLPPPPPPAPFPNLVSPLPPFPPRVALPHRVKIAKKEENVLVVFGKWRK